MYVKNTIHKFEYSLYNYELAGFSSTIDLKIFKPKVIPLLLGNYCYVVICAESHQFETIVCGI